MGGGVPPDRDLSRYLGVPSLFRGGFSETPSVAMGKSESDAVSMTLALWSALKAHPAGHLRPNEPRIFEPGKPIDFLGHRLTLQGKKVRIEPTPENLKKYSFAVERGVARIVDATSSTARANRARGITAICLLVVRGVQAVGWSPRSKGEGSRSN